MHVEGPSLDNLTTADLWRALEPETRSLAVRCLYADRVLRREGDAAIAATLNFREVAVRKLSIEQRVRYLLRSVRPDDSLASSLLLALHMTERRALLETFLTRLEIPHDGGIIDSDHDLEPPDDDKLRAAVVELYEKFPEQEVYVYLTTLLAMDRDSWFGVQPLLVNCNS